jgi:hypothetical protein
MPSTIQLVSREEFDDWCSRPFNPPKIATTHDKDLFFIEYWNCHSRIKGVLEALGRHDPVGDADFCMNDDAVVSRVISLTITSERLFTPAFVELSQRALRELPADYELWVTHDLLERELFFLAIFSDSVRGYFPKPEDVSLFSLK